MFSLGCLLYRLIAGYRVFGPRNAAEAAEEGMEPQQPQGFSDGQWRSVKKALSYPRVTRFGSVREFLDAFAAADVEEAGLESADDLDEEFADKPRYAVWLMAVLLLAGAGLAYQNGYLERWLPAAPPLAGHAAEQTVNTNDEIDSSEPEAVQVSPADSDTGEAPESIASAETIVDETSVIRPIVEPEVGPASNLVDFSSLPAASVEIPIRLGREESEDILVIEDAAPVIVDFVRSGDLSRTLELRLDEVGFSGNRSPWASGQYAFSNAGRVTLPPGQARGRIELSMASDPLREADQISTLRLRDADATDAIYAMLRVNLRDDDQRRFEAELPANTIGFAASQASIRETDPAVQIDLVRFNPDQTSIAVDFVVNDITATEGQDYFAPGGSTVRFGPGQRSARLLIPLVQDNLVEGDEAFIMQLTNLPESAANGVYHRIAVMIRDDEPQSR